jgi:hypothetical protein
MGGESLRLQFGAGLKSFSELTDPREQEAGSPAPFKNIISRALFHFGERPEQSDGHSSGVVAKQKGVA